MQSIRRACRIVLLVTAAHRLEEGTLLMQYYLSQSLFEISRNNLTQYNLSINSSNKNILDLVNRLQILQKLFKMNSSAPVQNVTKKIQQIQLKFPRQFPPNKFMNPHMLLVQLNKAVKSRYDIQFVHVKYLMTKNRQQRYLNEHYPSNQNFQVDRNFNNIFNTNSEEANDFLEHLFKEAVLLKPPTDYNPEDAQKARQNELREQEMERLKNLKEKIKGIMRIYNEKTDRNDQVSRIMSIQGFKMSFDKQTFINNQFQIYAKGIANQPVIQRLQQESKQKNAKIQFLYKEIKINLYLNPTKQSDSIEKINTEYRLTNWSLNVFHQQHFITYFGTDDLTSKVNKINNGIRLASSISFNEFQNNIDSFSITTFLWNQTIMKMVVKLAQVKKIEKAREGNQYQYYFYLTYPPIYYINQMKKDQANSEKFLKFYDRVTNFVFLDNLLIGNNYFARYYLFNNTILKINLVLDDSLQGGDYQPVTEAHTKLQNLCKKFVGTIQSNDRETLYKPRYTLKTLVHSMDFQNFNKNNASHHSKQIQDKMWIIKYLILVMVRYNYITPTSKQIAPIMNHIEDGKNIEFIDCYLYVLWRTATNMWGYLDKKKKFYEYFIQQSEQVKKMNVKNIMKRLLEQSESIVYIYRVSLTPSGYLFNPPTPQMKGRLLKQYVRYADFFLRVSICEESQIQLKNQKYITKMFFRNHMDEIIILDRAYTPLGWSPSQLRSFSLWYVHEIKGRCSLQQKQKDLPQLRKRHILNFLGDFSQIQNPAKKAARIGQSFSSSWTYSSENIKSQVIDDIESSQGIKFTDGIGKISQDLLQKISLRLNIRDLSVIQVRYKGAKGVLVLDPQLGKNTIHLRKSMIKYSCDDKNAQKYLDILDWNKYKAGFLNRQIVILLRTLGVQDLVFSGLQQEHVNRISKMTFKDCSIFKHMNDDFNSDICNLQPANKTILNLLNSGFELQREPFFRGVLETLKKNGYHQLKVKSNICIQKSARIIGIADEDGILNENQVYCSVYDHFAEKPIREVIDGPAIITRNPCLDPADIRLVTCIGKKQIEQRFQKKEKENKFEKLWNVVIMPIKGKYPLTSQISGSDLDGDNFFICWDDRLIPKTIFPPNLIDEPPNQNKKEEKVSNPLDQKETYKKMLDFFIDYTNYEKLGQIDNSHLIHADRDLQNFANNDKCKRLAKIHGKAVDFPKTGYCPPVDPELFCSQYPDFMEKQNAKVYVSLSILGKLYRDIKNRIQSLLEDKVYINVTEIDRSLIFDYKFDQSEEEVTGCIQVLRRYQRQMTNLISLIGVDSEYEVYSGNFSTVKNKVKNFGKNRLISTILSLRQRFFEQFFYGLYDDQSKYKSTGVQDRHMKQPKYFSEDARKKAQMYYLVSYICKFSDLKQTTPEFNKLKEQIQQILIKLKITHKQGKYCGFVWFIIPKVILNLKITFNTCQKNKILGQQNENGEEDQIEEDQEFI